MLYLNQITISPTDSGGFHRTPDIPLESRYATGFHWFPPESGNSTGFHWCPVDMLSRKSLDRFRRLRWNMLVSSGLRQTPHGINIPIWPLSHQDIPGFESGGFREFLAEKVGECTVLNPVASLRQQDDAHTSLLPQEMTFLAQIHSFIESMDHLFDCRYDLSLA